MKSLQFLSLYILTLLAIPVGRIAIQTNPQQSAQFDRADGIIPTVVQDKHDKKQDQDGEEDPIVPTY